MLLIFIPVSLFRGFHYLSFSISFPTFHRPVTLYARSNALTLKDASFIVGTKLDLDILKGADFGSAY